VTKPRGALLPFWEHASLRFSSVRVFNRRTVVEYCRTNAAAKGALYAWFAEAQKANWNDPNDIKTAHPSASVINSERVVFNIKGNHYRIVVAIKYRYHAVYIRFIGTHAEYDRIDAATV
jgi:mRNA interferase HigB